MFRTASIVLAAALAVTPALAQQAGQGQQRGAGVCAGGAGIECPTGGPDRQAGRGAGEWEPGQGRFAGGGQGQMAGIGQGSGHGPGAGPADGTMQGPHRAQMAGLHQGAGNASGQGQGVRAAVDPAGPQTQTQARLGPNGTPQDGDHTPTQQRLRLHAPSAN